MTGNGWAVSHIEQARIRRAFNLEADPIAMKAYRAASPITHVSSSAAPLLLIHGDADLTVPFHQSELMLEAMKKARVPAQLIRLPAGGHRIAMEAPKHTDWPDFLGEAVHWLDQHLKASTTAGK